MRAAELLEHDGVRLRRWRDDDLDIMLRAVTESVDHLSPWMAWATGGYDRKDAALFLEKSAADWRTGAAYNYAIVAPDGAVAGACSLMSRIGPGGLEIGYWLHPHYTGRGIATRAAAALVAEAFRLGADRVEIQHDAANERSGAIPRRLGFVEVGRRRPPRDAMTPGEAGEDVIWRVER